MRNDLSCSSDPDSTVPLRTVFVAYYLLLIVLGPSTQYKNTTQEKAAGSHAVRRLLPRHRQQARFHPATRAAEPVSHLAVWDYFDPAKPAAANAPARR